ARLVADGRLRDYVQRRLSSEVRDGGGTVIGPDGPAWKRRNKAHRSDRAWVQAWSPEQIAKRLPVDFPDDESMRISH
ncbi:IS30 family transposase, partial [Saccharothrix sp. MB29]|nr:IS30 family transposase [Saccharothrix sp. MB29]